MATLLKPGDQAPNFTLIANNGEQFTLSAMRGRRLLLWFIRKRKPRVVRWKDAACAIRVVTTRRTTSQLWE